MKKESVWQVKSLGEVARLIRGVSYDNSQVSKSLVGNYIPIFRANNIKDGLLFDDLVYVPSFLVKEDQLIRNGDILIAMSSGSKNIVGKTTQAKSDLRYSFGAFCGLLRPSSAIDSKYLGYYFRTKNYRSYISNSSRGANINNLRKESFESIQIPLPPLPIQKQIAEILEKADEAKQKRKEANKLTDEFLQSVFIEMFGDPVKNPKGWDIVTLDTLGEWQSGGTPSRLTKEYFLGDVPWYTSGELNTMYLTKSIECITEKAIVDSNAKLIEPNTILVGMYDTAAFKLGITTRNCSCNQAIAYSKLELGKVDKLFLYYLMKIGREYFISGQRGVRQKNLNLTMIRETKITLPPINLQQQFAEIVNKTEALKEKQKQSEQELDNLFQSLMQKAFKGELVS